MAPPRWIQASGRDEVIFLASGPSLDDAKAWTASGDSSFKPGSPKAYYLVVSLQGGHYVFRIYAGPPSSRQLADDTFDALTRKTLPIAYFDSQADAVSLFLSTASRRTAVLFRPERLDGSRDATLYGPDGRYFTPVVGEAVLLRGSELSCASRYGAFERTRLAVTDAGDVSLGLACGYQYGDSDLSLFVTRRPDERVDRVFGAYIRDEQKRTGVSAKRPGIRTGPREVMSAGKSWVDSEGAGQGLWITRGGRIPAGGPRQVHPRGRAPFDVGGRGACR